MMGRAVGEASRVFITMLLTMPVTSYIPRRVEALISYRSNASGSLIIVKSRIRYDRWRAPKISGWS